MMAEAAGCFSPIRRLSSFPSATAGNDDTKSSSSAALAFSSSMAFPRSLKLRSRPLTATTTNNSSSSRCTSASGGELLPSTQPKSHVPSHTSAPPRIMTRSSGIIGKAQKWWEKGLQPNMREVMGAQHLVDSLLSSGDKLVVVDFFSPGCGGCKALHPKICQLAEMNPDVLFLQVNYEEHKSMCYALNVHVLPFFRFYRGAHGRLCSFSCTNATIKKFKDALAKYGADFCSLEPTKGLEEKELLALAANKDLSFNYAPKPQPSVVASEQEKIITEKAVATPGADSERPLPLPLPLPLPFAAQQKMERDPEKRTLISKGRSTG
ncbi:thioredoxin-like 1-1, chloroplastic [Coffea arabica]|uniref:Thioredoxin-like 1-1, chloroplastic n=1 Tax=Coffea arabica TaxID=13443 RepID=A0A6P6UCF1_COFAR|nr:thioredoxin-like 1-1, chloroplastic [Coffea arabica]